MIRRRVSWVLVATIALLLQGCAMLSGSDETRLRCTLESGESLNPYTNGQSSALVLRMYELRAIGNFLNSSYIQLVENEQSLLAGDITWSDNITVLPNQSVILPHEEVTSGAAYFGVLAEFREYDQPGTIWRAHIEIPAGKTTKCLIKAADTQVTIERK